MGVAGKSCSSFATDTPPCLCDDLYTASTRYAHSPPGDEGGRGGLPGAPKFNASLGLQYDYLFRSHYGFSRADIANVGGYYNNLQEEGLETGDYTTVNLATGLQPGRWDLQLYIQNLTNSSAATYLTQDVQYPSVWRLRPRTMG